MADMTGLSLNAYASDGDDIYGDLDDINRAGPGPWQSESIGHIEFSPLDNLALYGWNKYINLESRLMLHPWLIIVLLAITVPVTTLLLARVALFRQRATGTGAPARLSSTRSSS